MLAAYIFITAIVFLYVLFPADTVKSYLIYRLSGFTSDVSLDIDNLRLRIPPGIVLQDVGVRYLNKPAALIESIQLVPAYISLFSRNAAVDFTGTLAGGNIVGRTNISGSPAIRDLSFDDIRMAQLPIVQELFPIKISGRASGALKCGEDGKGSAALKLAQFKCDLNTPMMGMKELTFSRIETEAEMNGREVRIKRIDLDGPQASGSGSGTVTISQPFETSRINLSGTVKLNPSLMQSVGALLSRGSAKEGGIPIRITGTFKEPNFSLR